jgi:Ca2+-binding RTX toxin-like protein
MIREAQYDTRVAGTVGKVRGKVMRVMKWSGLLVALSVGLLVATLVVMLNVAHASHFPNCGHPNSPFHPTNTPTPGNDFIVGTTGKDILAGGAGNDVIQGLGGDDVLCSNDGDDTIHGGNGADSLFAGGGNDTVTGGDDNDDIYGQEGHDRLFAISIFTGPLPTFPQTCRESGELSLVEGPEERGGNQETELGVGNTLVGGDGNDLVVGAIRSDFLVGGPERDDLYGLGEKDKLWGDSGVDCLSGGPNNDYLYDWDPQNVEPADLDTLWGGDFAWDLLNARDGDGADRLDGGRVEFGDDNCYQDPGDVWDECD